MSEGTKVASLFAEIGFKVSEKDIESIKQAFDKLKDAIDSIVAETVKFASSLVRLSKSTGLSPKLLQDFHRFGIEAGVANEEVDSMLNTMANVANKAYWGLGNQYAQWGLFFGRGETAASALLKTLQKLSVSSPQKQREIANELGLQLDAALMLAEKYKKTGFKVNNPFALTDKEVSSLHELNIEFSKIEANQKGFWRKLAGTQSETQLKFTKLYSQLLEKIQKTIIEIAETPVAKEIISAVVLLIQTIPTILKFVGYLVGSLVAFKIFFKLGIAFFGLLKSTVLFLVKGLKLIPFGLVIGFLNKLLSVAGIKTGFNFWGSLQEGFDRLLDSSGSFGIKFRSIMEDSFGYLLDLMREKAPEFGEQSGILEFLELSKQGKVFEGLGGLIDRWYSAFIVGIGVLISKLKIYGNWLWQILSNGTRDIFTWVFDTLNNDVFKRLILNIYKALDYIPGVDLSEEIADLEQELEMGDKRGIAKRLSDTFELANREFEEENKKAEKTYKDMWRQMGYDKSGKKIPNDNSTAVPSYSIKNVQQNITSSPIPSSNSNRLSIDHSGATSKNFDIKIDNYKGSPEQLVSCIQDWADSVGMSFEEVAQNQAIVEAYCIKGGAGQY